MKSYTFLIIGSNGFLGSAIVNYLKKKKISYFTVARSKSNFNLNLKNYYKLKKLFIKNNFSIVINCAAKINLNYCEKNFKSALKINFHLPRFLAQMSELNKFKFVQISTDHIYKGKINKSNKEYDELSAINNYSKSKIMAEKSIKNIKKNLIIRTNFTGKKSFNKPSFTDWLYRAIKKKESIGLFNDMFTSTIDIKNCAKYIVDLSIAKSSGVYNLGTRDFISKEKFAIKFAKKINSKIIYKSIKTEKKKLKRGKNLGLNIKKIEKKLNLNMPSSNQIINNIIKDYI